MLSLKYTKIIATLGPASSTLDQMRVLIASGADCFRLNMSHGGERLMQPLIDRAREAARLEGCRVVAVGRPSPSSKNVFDSIEALVRALPLHLNKTISR